MSNILASWSGMRKYLEQEMTADSLKGRIRYNCTTYVGMDGTNIIELYIDKKLFKQFSWETLNAYFWENGLTSSCENYKKPLAKWEYWEGFYDAKTTIPMSDRTEYTSEEFCDALRIYRNRSISDSINSENHIVKMFALMDRRTGKRTLIAKKEEMLNSPEWLQNIYQIRCDSEGINFDSNEENTAEVSVFTVARRIIEENFEAFEELAK